VRNLDKTEMPFLAGTNDKGEPVFESLEVEFIANNPNHVRLMKSPLLTRNLAAGDILRAINPDTAEYELIKRSGNLSIRLFGRDDLGALEEVLSSKLEKLGGCLDLKNQRALVYTIHVSIGFQVIELALDDVCKDYPEVIWYYGNVYDPEDGATPLEWWTEFDAQG
jgi:hypothetical protein